MDGPKVLVIEDDPALREALRYNLASEGYDVAVAADGADGFRAARDGAPDVIILDLMLPTMGGLDVCRSLRQEGSITPILMLTARDSEVDRVVGLEVGADDYVTKPFSMRELLARVAAMLRRAEMQRSGTDHPGAEVLEFDGLVIDLPQREVRLNGEAVPMRRKEFDLLAYLASRPNRPVSRETLLQNVWGYEYAGDTRTVDVHIRWLRMKIENDPSNPERLLTMRGVGYRFRP